MLTNMNCYYSFNELDFLRDSAVTIGMFDGVHLGHQSVLNETIRIAKENDWNSTVITFSNSPSTYFDAQSSEKNICSIEEKTDQLSHLGIDNVIVVPFDYYIANTDAIDFFNQVLINKCRIKALILGYDNHFGRSRQGSIDFVKLHYPEIISISVPAKKIDDKTISSTLIKKCLSIGNIIVANKYLGYDFSLHGKVIIGKQMGRKLGFPTANLKIADQHKYVLLNGVYACYLFVKETKYYCLVNIGTRPTVDYDHQISIEAYILSFSNEIYDQDIKVFFIERLRDEKKFENVSFLKDQIQEDVNYVSKKYLN